MLSRPRLRRSFEVVSHQARELFLLDESRQLIFQGPIYVRLAPLLDGRRGIEDLLREVAPHPMHEVLLALGQLEGRGCLVDGPAEASPEAAWYDALPGVPPAESAPLRVSVRAVGQVDLTPLQRALGASGIPMDPAGPIEIVVTDDY